MTVRTALTRRFGPADLPVYLLGVFGLSLAITGIWLGMRAVMDIGGACASGGAYEIRTACPGGVEVLLVLGFPIGFASAGLMLWRGSRIGPGYTGLVVLAWPALFLGLGWNFLEYGVRNPFGDGVELGWLIPGVIFILMGGVPLVGWIASRKHGPAVPSVPESATPIELTQLATAMRRVSMRAGRRAAATTTVAAALSPQGVAGGVTPSGVEAGAGVETGAGVEAGPAGLVDQLERLARLHDAGALGELEYMEAKQAVIAAASRGDDAASRGGST